MLDSYKIRDVDEHGAREGSAGIRLRPPLDPNWFAVVVSTKFQDETARIDAAADGTESLIDALLGLAVPGCERATHEAEDLRIDTHGADVIDPVWRLLEIAYEQCGALPTLLERDFNFPPIEQLVAEVDHIRQIQRLYTTVGAVSENAVVNH